MTGEIKIFEKEEFGKVRTLVIDNEPWFVGKDVASILGYSNTKDALIKHVDEEDRNILKGSDLRPLENHIPKDVLPVDFVQIDVPNRGLTIINESGVYSLILGSKLPEAKQFKHWVTSEVLPSIRKTGTYNLPQDYLSALKALVVSEEQKQTLALENAEMKPKAEYYDALCNREHLTNFRDTAKQLGVSQSDFIQLLLDNNYIYRDKHKHLKPYNQYIQKDNRLFKIKDFASSTSEHAGCQTLITIKGKQEFMKLLK